MSVRHVKKKGIDRSVYSRTREALQYLVLEIGFPLIFDALGKV
jgi:hypothetical protein